MVKLANGFFAMGIVENRRKSTSQSQHLSTIGVKAYAHATLNGVFSSVITNERPKRIDDENYFIQIDYYCSVLSDGIN